MKPPHFFKDFFKRFPRASFTLIEILLVVGIMAVIAVVLVLVLNPAEIFKKSRDSARLSDMAVLTKALSLYNADVGGFFGTTSIMYVSVPDPTAPTQGNQCQSLGLPALPGGWSYHCASQSNYRKTDGSGWIPINFGTISYGSPLASLPKDPVNTTSTGLYYTYNVGSYELSAAMESEKYGSGSSSKAATDGGKYSDRLELGTDLSLLPIDPGTASSSTTSSPPVIANIGKSGITSSSVTISWTTDAAADSLVNYGLTASYGSSGSDAIQVINHTITLSGLIASTTYHYQVQSANANGTALSSDDIFTTSAFSPPSGPTISSVLVSGIASSTATVSWTTDVVADSLVSYGLTTAYGSSISNAAQITSHVINLSGLIASTTYHYQVQSANANGTTTSSDSTFITSAGFATIAMSGTPTSTRVAATSSISVALPSGISTGDMVFIFYTWGTTSTITGPAGYATGIPATYYIPLGTGPANALYWHKYTAGDPTSVTATLGAPTANFEAIAVAYSGVDTINPIDAKATSTNVSATTHTSPSITTTQSNDKLLMLYGVFSPHTFSLPSEGTIRQSVTTGPSSAWVDFSLGGSGATGNQTITINTAATGVEFQAALRPASL